MSILPPCRVNDRSVFQTQQSNDIKNSPLLCFLGCSSATRIENNSKSPRRLSVLIREMHIDTYSAQINAMSVKQGYLCMKAFCSGRPKCPRANMRKKVFRRVKENCSLGFHYSSNLADSSHNNVSCHLSPRTGRITIITMT